MKVIYTKGSVRIETTVGTIEGDSMLHYYVAKLLGDGGIGVSQTVDDDGRTVLFTHPIEE